jgi:transposase
MGQNFIACDRDQVLLLPVDLSEWLPVDHLARFVIETVEQLDLQGMYAYYRWDGRGRPAHDPAMMTALVLYATAVGVMSSRQIERRCVEDIAFRVICANRQPDHATIARFLARHREELSGLFFEVLALCRRAGMVSVGTVAVDSTKLAANASGGQNRTFEGLREEARRLIDEGIETNRREDQLFGEKRGDELPDELADPRTRAGRIRELLEQARRERERVQAQEAEVAGRREEKLARTGKGLAGQRRKDPQASTRAQPKLARKYNVTDPDSSVVRHRGMLMQGYGIQTAVNEHQIILAASVGGGSDQGQLAGIVQNAERTLKRLGISDPIGEVLADTGYWHARQIEQIEQTGTRVLIPPQRRYTSPTARRLRTELATEPGKQAYGQRQQLVEPVFAHWKHIRGITRVLRRGRTAVQGEIDLIATTHNLLKLKTALTTT